MIKKLKYILILVFIFSCKTAEEKIKVNSLKVEYNILFNGENYFNEGLSILENNYYENYWEIIPLIKSLKYSDQSSLLPTKNFEKSEEKAIKAIQKSKKEQVKIQDKAYLLLGKSRFYDQKYISALQAFNQIDEKKSEAILWKTMIYLNLDQPDIALRKAKEEVQKIGLESNDLNILKSITQSEIINNNYDEALAGLKKIYKQTNDKQLKSRSSFISAQIYSELNKIDSAKAFFSKTINSGINKSSEIYLRSKLKIMSLSDGYKTEDYQKLIKSERYPDKEALILYYEALSYLKNNPDKAAHIFKKSLTLKDEDKFLKLKTYRKLLDINYNKSNYLIASTYIDSLLIYEDKSSKNFFDLKNIKNRLSNIIELEEKNIQIDSLIMLSNLSDKEIEKIFKKPDLVFNKVLENKTTKINNGIFYYNNEAAIEKGILEFRKKWGKIKLEDNWKMNPNYDVKIENNSNNYTVKNYSQENLNFKLNKSETDSLNKIYNKNLLLLGIYYNEFFKDFKKSNEKIEKIDYKFLIPEEIAQSKYYKYLSYFEKNDANYIKIKKDILDNHPNSIYAKKIIQSNSIMIQDLDESIDSIRSLFMKNKFLTASNILDSLYKLSIKREDLYKLKMIQSDIVVKRESVDSYLKFLKNLKLEFPENKSELEKIINIVGDIQSKKSLDFKDESLVLGFFINKNVDFNHKGFVKEYYDDKIDLIVKYGFSKLEQAEYEAEELVKNDKRLLSNKYFVISTSQFINALVFKTLDKLNK